MPPYSKDVSRNPTGDNVLALSSYFKIRNSSRDPAKVALIEFIALHLLIADNTLLFLENDLGKTQNFKWLLSCYGKLSGMNINFDKSKIL